jgi:hypothetical protein
MTNSIWDSLFENPVLRNYLEEAYQEIVEAGEEQAPPAPEDDSQPKLSQEEIEKLAADLQQGTISQDDIINMYKSGKLTQGDIRAIVDLSKGEAQEGEGEQDPGAEQPADAEPQTEEELLAQQIEQTNDLFVKFALYDKIMDLSDKLDFFKDNFEDIGSELYQRVLQLREFLNILSSLVFNLETAVAYQMYGSILLQLTEMFKEYSENVLPQKEKEEKLKDLKREAIDNNDIPVTDEEKWAEDNESFLLDPEYQQQMDKGQRQD